MQVPGHDGIDEKAHRRTFPMVSKMNGMEPQWRAAVETLIVVIFWVSCVRFIYLGFGYRKFPILFIGGATHAPFEDISMGRPPLRENDFYQFLFFHCAVLIDQYPATNFRRFRGGEWASECPWKTFDESNKNERSIKLTRVTIVRWQYRTIHRICIMWFHSISPKNLLFIQLNDGGADDDGVGKKKKEK